MARFKDAAKALQLTGKLHFGYIYGRCNAIAQRTATDFGTGLAFVGTILLHQVLSLMSPPVNPADVGSAHDHNQPHGSHLGSSLTYSRSASVLGYCLLPLVLVAMLGIAVQLDGLFGYLITSLAITWCAYSSSSMFTAVGKSTLSQKPIDPILRYVIRPHDFDERTSRIPYGLVLW
jgi:hypothetical protein